MRLCDSCKNTILWFGAQKYVLGLCGIGGRSLELIVPQKCKNEKLQEIAIRHCSTAHFDWDVSGGFNGRRYGQPAQRRVVSFVLCEKQDATRLTRSKIW
jgi:hypothetical protein